MTQVSDSRDANEEKHPPLTEITLVIAYQQHDTQEQPSLGPSFLPLQPVETICYAVTRPGRQLTVEQWQKERLAYEEIRQNPVPLPDGTEDDATVPYLMEKYGDRLPFKTSTHEGLGWEVWVDVIG
jgi:hypothetical protein